MCGEATSALMAFEVNFWISVFDRVFIVAAKFLQIISCTAEETWNKFLDPSMTLVAIKIIEISNL